MASVLRIKDKKTLKWQPIIALKGEKGDSFPDAPADGKQYARQDEKWTVITGGGGTIYFSDIQGDPRGNAGLATEFDRFMQYIGNAQDTANTAINKADRAQGQAEVAQKTADTANEKADELKSTKQDLLKAGTGISIDGNVISATGGGTATFKDLQGEPTDNEKLNAVFENYTKRIDSIEPVDTMKEGEMRPITSNAVYGVVGDIESQLANL